MRINTLIFLSLILLTASALAEEKRFNTNDALTTIIESSGNPCPDKVLKHTQMTEQQCLRKAEKIIAECTKSVLAGLGNTINQDELTVLMNRTVLCRELSMLDIEYTNEKADKWLSKMNQKH